MNNQEFLKVIKSSFVKYLVTSPKSNQKLKIIHGAIAKDLSNILGKTYKIHSLGFGNGKEKTMMGRYTEKRVDIAIEKDKEILAGIGLKFVMSNYSQNSNNYFENMLGETANIRTSGKPYFEIVIIPTRVPYFNKDKEITKYEKITEHNIKKYIKISQDNIETFMHTPNKTLIYLVDFPIPPIDEVSTKESYINYYISNNDFEITESKEKYEFGSAIIYNDYEKFADKVSHYIQSI